MGLIEFELHINDLENKCNLEKGFISSLQQENDWGFMIKIYAIFEALLSELICKSSDKPELISFFLKLDMCSKPIGKLELLKKLGLLGEPERKFLRALSDLRNTYAHNIKMVYISIADCINSFKNKQKKNIIKDLSFNLRKKDDFEKNMKLCIWCSSVTLLCQINERTYSKSL